MVIGGFRARDQALDEVDGRWEVRKRVLLGDPVAVESPALELRKTLFGFGASQGSHGLYIVCSRAGESVSNAGSLCFRTSFFTSSAVSGASSTPLR